MKRMSIKVKETIVFDGERTIQDLHSLSFEPSVSVADGDGDVVIDGVLHLVGEGTSRPSGLELSMEQLRQRVHVIQEAEGIMTFEHGFPIYITVAKERAPQPHAIDVSIDHVDYELVNERALLIEAVLVLDGVNEAERTVVEEPVAEEVQAEKEDALQPQPVRLLPNPLPDWGEGEVIEPVAAVAEVPPAEEQPEQIDEVQEPDQPEPEIVAEPELTRPEEETEVLPVAELEEVISVEEPEEREEHQERGEQETAPGYSSNFQSQELAGYLATLSEGRHTIRLHIAQQNDTFDTIGERYAAAPLSIARRNAADPHRPPEKGTVLWISDHQIHSK